MARDAIERVAAEVSVYPFGGSRIYVGTEARSALDVGYNDEVAVTLPGFGPGGSDIRVSGYLNASGQITIEGEIAESVSEEKEGSSPHHVTGFVEKLTGHWQDNHDSTERRWDDVFSLRAEPE